jgi:PAS domain S-box-containing protein
MLRFRFPGAIVFMIVAFRSSSVEHRTEVLGLLFAYVVALLILAFAAQKSVEQRYIRLLASILDVAAISGLAHSLDLGAWVLVLLVFPIMSAAHHLRFGWSFGVALFASLLGWVLVRREVVAVDSSVLVFLAIVFCGVAFNAAKLASSRDRFEQRVSETIDRVYSQLLAKRSLPEVMDTILGAALDITWSDVTAIMLHPRDAPPRMFRAARAGLPSESFDDAERILRKYSDEAIRRAPLALSLVKRPWLAKLAGKNAVAEQRWAGRLIPIMIGKTPFGVLGVFSQRSVHYTADDLAKLRDLIPVIAFTQQNAKLTEDVSRHLTLLYQIGHQLQGYKGLKTLFPRVVDLVSQYVGSEEAALFLADAEQFPLRKVAVAAPSVQEKLKELEETEARGTLTGIVFESGKPLVNNDIDPKEPHAGDYAAILPSKRTKHYMGAPVVIGHERLGVIRVLNKRGTNYDLNTGNTELDPNGFDEEDQELLTAIAPYIAGATRNARFIEKNRHFQDLIYKSPDPIIVIDKDGKIQNFNRECEKIWRIDEKSAIGREVADFYETTEHARELGRELWAHPEHTFHSRDARVRDFEGNIIPIRLSATLLFDEEGNLAGSIGVFKDARPIIRAQNEIIQQEKLAAIGSIAQTTGHDMKHDVGAILTYVDVLENDDPDTSMRSDIHAGILTAANGILNKLQNMLMTARARLPEKQVLSVKSLMTAFERSVAHRAALSKIQLVVSTPEDDVVVLADPEQMRQVFANLFGNSIHAIDTAAETDGREGRIMFSADVENDRVRITWCDNGAGMDGESRLKVFSAFFSTKPSGSGLGLYISKSIVEVHEGTIAIASSPGEGTCFDVILPLFQEIPEGDEGLQR